MAEVDYELAIQQHNAIMEEQCQHPLVSAVDAISTAPDSRLIKEISASPVMVKKMMNSVAADYRAVRYIRRDGSCFYRAASFRLLEQLLDPLPLLPLSSIVSLVARLRERIIAVFSDYAEDFCDVVSDLIEQIQNRTIQTSEELRAAFVCPATSEFILFFFRYAVSCYLRDHADCYGSLVEAMGFASMEAYCQSEVEVVGRDSDHLHIVAFVKCFLVPIRVECIDGGAGDRAITHTFHPRDGDEGDTRYVDLLFRPGHYDLLYRR